jgi:hypothetical protein
MAVCVQVREATALLTNEGGAALKGQGFAKEVRR